MNAINFDEIILQYVNRKNNDTNIYVGEYQGEPIVIYSKHLHNKKFPSPKYGGELNYFNDRFRKYTICADDPEKYELNVMWPATKEDMLSAKHTQKTRMFETPEIYKKFTLPHIKLGPEWMRNIITGKREQEYILYQDDDFVFMPDIKWDGNPTSAYCLAIAKDANIKSIRDLTSEHIPMLEHIYKTGISIMEKKYEVSEDSLRVYFHYHPTYWQLHIHFVSLSIERDGNSVDYAITLHTVIQNLKLSSTYYQDATLETLVKDVSRYQTKTSVTK